MAEWNGFGGLDLSNVDANTSGGRLAKGTYTVKSSGSAIEQVGNTQNKKLVVTFTDVDGSGDIRMNFNIAHSNEVATDIARRQLKSFLVAANHPSPNQPNDVSTLDSLECKIAVGDGKPWINSMGQEVTSTEIKKFMPTTAASAASAAAKPKAEIADDEIPF